MIECLPFVRGTDSDLDVTVIWRDWSGEHPRWERVNHWDIRPGMLGHVERENTSPSESPHGF